MSNKMNLNFSSGFRWKQCIVDVYTEAEGSGSCTKPRITLFESFVEKGSTEPIKAFCSDYTDDSDRCSKLLAKFPISNRINNKNGIRSPVIGAVELMSTI